MGFFSDAWDSAKSAVGDVNDTIYNGFTAPISALPDPISYIPYPGTLPTIGSYDGGFSSILPVFDADPIKLWDQDWSSLITKPISDGISFITDPMAGVTGLIDKPIDLVSWLAGSTYSETVDVNVPVDEFRFVTHSFTEATIPLRFSSFHVGLVSRTGTLPTIEIVPEAKAATSADFLPVTSESWMGSLSELTTFEKATIGVAGISALVGVASLMKK